MYGLPLEIVSVLDLFLISTPLFMKMFGFAAFFFCFEGRELHYEITVFIMRWGKDQQSKSREKKSKVESQSPAPGARWGAKSRRVVAGQEALRYLGTLWTPQNDPKSP